MCICTVDVLCEEAKEDWVALNEYRETPQKQRVLNGRWYEETKAAFVNHRTFALHIKQRTGGSTGYAYYPDWRERLKPDWKPTKEQKS